MTKAPDASTVAAREIVRAPDRAEFAMRDCERGRAVVVVLRDFVPRVSFDVVLRDEMFDCVGREIMVVVARGIIAFVAAREDTFFCDVRDSDTVARSREAVFPRVAVPKDFVVVEFAIAPDGRVAVVVATFVAPTRDAARAVSSYSTPRALQNASTPRHTPKIGLKTFIPFVYRLAKL